MIYITSNLISQTVPLEGFPNSDHFKFVTFTSPQALKVLRTRQFCPLVVFIKAENADGVRRLHQNARVDNPSGQSTLSVSQDLISNLCNMYK